MPSELDVYKPEQWLTLEIGVTALTETAESLVPPTPEPAPDVMGPFELARRMRTNGISVYSR
jgi:hypothetical protein